MVYGGLRVTLQKVISHGDCVLRRMEAVEDKPKSKMASWPLTVTQMQLTSWPVQGLPHSSAEICSTSYKTITLTTYFTLSIFDH